MDYTHIPTISCFYSEANDNSLITSQAHFEYQMILVTSGTASFFIHHQHYELKEKSLVFISSLERHSFVIQDRAYRRYVASISGELIMTHINEEELLSIFLQRPKGFSHVIDLSNEAYNILLPHFINMEKEFTQKPAFYIPRSISLVQSILIDLYRTHPEFFSSRSHTNVSGAVLNAQRYINDHYDQSITLQEIADANFISRHTLSLAFKDIVGITFKDYLVLFRITEAKKLLITSDYSIEEIAEKVGYLNVNNFIQIFKSREAVTPLKYRKLYSQPKPACPVGGSCSRQESFL